jgi:hypothetical protein
MLHTNTPAPAGPPPAGRYLVQIAAPGDPPSNGRFAVERVARRNVDERVLAEFAICSHIDLLHRELRNGDRVHAEQRYRGRIRTLLRRVELRGESVLLYPLRSGRGRKAEPIPATHVAIMGLVTGTYTQFRVWGR